MDAAFLLDKWSPMLAVPPLRRMIFAIIDCVAGVVRFGCVHVVIHQVRLPEAVQRCFWFLGRCRDRNFCLWRRLALATVSFARPLKNALITIQRLLKKPRWFPRRRGVVRVYLVRQPGSSRPLEIRPAIRRFLRALLMLPAPAACPDAWSGERYVLSPGATCGADRGPL